MATTIVPADWTIERDTKVISYIGGDHAASPSYSTVIDFHRWLQDLADDAVATASSGDELDITNLDPSRRSTDNIVTLINGYTIGATEAEHLYDGSIIMNDGDDIWDGIVNFGNSDVQIQIIQDGAVLSDDWWNFGGAGLNALASAGISHRFMIKTRTAGADIDGRRLIGTARRYLYTYSEFSINGTSRGNNVLALTDSLDLNNETADPSGWTGITNTTEGYALIDVNNDGTDEAYYSEWNTNQPTRSINDFYEKMKYDTRDGSAETLYGLSGELFRGITHEVTITSGTGTWAGAEELQWGTGDTAGTGQLLAVDDTDGTTATTLWMQLLTGVIPDSVTLTGQTSSATAVVGVTPTTPVAISTPFVGASTGSAIIGAYGVGIEKLDLASTDKVKDLTGATITPPNNVTNTVAGLIHNEDRVLVGPWDGSSVDTNGDPAITKDQLSLATALTANDETEIVVTEVIPLDTPSSGFLRVTDDNGYEKRIAYSSWDTPTKTFTIDTSYHTTEADNQNDFGGVTESGTYQASTTNDVWIAYIDDIATGDEVAATALVDGTIYVIKTPGDTVWTDFGSADNLAGTTFTMSSGPGTGTGVAYTQSATSSFTSVQSGSRNLVTLVRDGESTPIKQFISSWSQTSSNQTITAIRTTDE